jgi:formylglycine-generating enzyme
LISNSIFFLYIENLLYYTLLEQNNHGERGTFMNRPQYLSTLYSIALHTFFSLLIILCFLFLPTYSMAQTAIKHKTLSDKVEYWHRKDTKNPKPWFWQQIETLINVVFGETDTLPFKKSTAFLVGVGNYKHLDTLDFVDADLDAMRTYLLGSGGFDEVYVAKNEVVTDRLIKKHMQIKFKKELGVENRLLFYYSGHGADFGGKSGYMQFSKAEKGNSVDHVLKIDTCEDWSRMIKAKHILFIFDCCVSGLAFTPKGDKDSRLKLAGTLSGNGSRIVLTAGTGDEKSYGMDGRSVFTRSLLTSLENTSYTNDGLLTIDQAFGECKTRVGKFTVETGKPMPPRMWEISVSGRNYNGTFLFINPLIGEKDFVAAHRDDLDVTEKQGGGELKPPKIIRHTGIIKVDVKTAGTLFFDDKEAGQIPRASSALFEDIVTGNYDLTMKYEDGQTESYPVEVEKDKIAHVAFIYIPPPDWMVWIQGGSFRMGSDAGDDDEKPVHRVTVDSFYISKYEVTQAEYLEFCQSTNTHFPQWLEPRNTYNINTGTDDAYKKIVGPGKENHPVVGVSWYDAAAYCNWLSEQEGLNPCYSGSGESIACKFYANGYRLPTEAEWEYAARGGEKSKGYTYSGSNDPDIVAWYADNANGTTHEVGGKRPNELGLYDMSGNVWEWCWDWYGPYSGETRNNPRGPETGTVRVLRGGCWFSFARGSRSACRFGSRPSFSVFILGFRLARGHTRQAGKQAGQGGTGGRTTGGTMVVRPPVVPGPVGKGVGAMESSTAVSHNSGQ